ncbi:MAG: zinc ribbon domain-containing protein [Trichodesmium sp. St18_bin1]|nr:zinc ribbon domain-containing protein [Trichodesmium sp. St18_bin1]
MSVDHRAGRNANATRVFECEHCNFSCDRDLNAGLNLAMAVSSTVTACGLDNADVARMKQE